MDIGPITYGNSWLPYGKMVITLWKWVQQPIETGKLIVGQLFCPLNFLFLLFGAEYDIN